MITFYVGGSVQPRPRLEKLIHQAMTDLANFIFTYLQASGLQEWRVEKQYKWSRTAERPVAQAQVLHGMAEEVLRSES